MSGDKNQKATTSTSLVTHRDDSGCLQGEIQATACTISVQSERGFIQRDSSLADPPGRMMRIMMESHSELCSSIWVMKAAPLSPPGGF